MSSLKDVAALAHVSPITVSRVINSPNIVSEKTRIKVEAAMKQLNYSINPVAQALVTKRTNVIDVYIPKYINISDQYVMQLIAGISDVLSQKAYSFRISRDLSQNLVSDGYIVSGLTDSELVEVIEYTNNLGKPMVLFGHTENKMIDYIDVDNFTGAKNMTNYLLKKGHKKINFLNVTFEDDVSFPKDRLAGYQAALKEQGIKYEPSRVFYSDNGFESGYHRALKILENRGDETAYFCASDSLALGMIQACKELGLKVPEDLSIVGFDGFGQELMTYPNITTVQQPIFYVGRLLAEALIERIHDRQKEAHQEMIVPIILEGGTIKSRS